MTIPSVSVRQVRPCSVCCSFCNGELSYGSCNLNHSSIEKRVQKFALLTEGVKIPWPLSDAEKLCKEYHETIATTIPCECNFTPTEMQELINEHNKGEEIESDKVWGPSELADLILSDMDKEPPCQ